MEDFEKRVETSLASVRGVVRRMIGDPDDVEDVIQDALTKAFEKRGEFREESSFATWLTSIAVNEARDKLRRRKRWRVDAQVHASQHLHATEKETLYAIFVSPEHRYDAREHIAFCFTCVGRSLEPEQQTALILRDMLDYTNREASKIAGVTESVLRHSLSAARKQMTERFENLCGLVNKDGVCYQCEGLRSVTPEDRQGPAVPKIQGDSPEARYENRLRVIQNADVDAGATQKFHDYEWRALTRIEESVSL